MGKRRRSREKLDAPTSDYVDAEGNLLTLRGSMSPATRRQYHETLHGNVLSQEDAWQRATEYLFERLAVRWVIAEMPIERQKELLARFRFGTRPEREWVRQTLRAHCAEHFPDVEAP